MTDIDLNCDMGEGNNEAGVVVADEASLMPYISSTNIACGFHAGNPESIFQTILLAKEHGVAIGAHVSFLDRAHFGRLEMDVDESLIYEWVEQQLILFGEIANMLGMPVNHVKPHGALYNMSAREPAIAKAIASAVRDYDHTLLLFGLSGSHSISEAAALGLATVDEIFADRRYRLDGSLVPRAETYSLIKDQQEAERQVLSILQKGFASTREGEEVRIKAGSICIHGDGEQAISFAKGLNHCLKEKGFTIKAPLKQKQD